MHFYNKLHLPLEFKELSKNNLLSFERLHEVI
jgi:hypothetical protein